MTAHDAASRPGLVLCHNVFDPAEPKKVLLRKGRVLTSDDADQLKRLGTVSLHLLQLETGDVGEDEAGQRLASAVRGSGVAVGGNSESQVRLEAEVRGLLHVDTGALAAVNDHDGVAVWTLDDRVPVEACAHVASAKIAPLAISEEVLQAATTAAGAGVVRVAPYRSRRIGVLVRERMPQSARSKFEASITAKVRWFGSEQPAIEYVGADPVTATRGLGNLVVAGVELVLVGGAGSTDPLDPVFAAIHSLGGTILRTGVPAHPGSTYWLAQVGTTPILGLASCGMFSQLTALDLLLPAFFSGEPLDARALTSLAVGGLIGRDRAYRFPQYGQGLDLASG